MNAWFLSPKCGAVPTPLYPDIEFFSSVVCGHSCGQSGFSARFSREGKSVKHRCCKASRSFSSTRPGYSHGTPKCGAVPTPLYPDIEFFSSVVCGHSCGQSGFSARFSREGKSVKHRCCKASRSFSSTRPGYSHGTPKCGAVPTPLYPDAKFAVCLA